jgi:hypothetical protein
VDQGVADVAPGSRADAEIDAFVARRERQRLAGADDDFGRVIVEDRVFFEEEWAEIQRREAAHRERTRLDEARAFHMRQARNLSGALSALVRHHLDQVQRLDGRR